MVLELENEQTRLAAQVVEEWTPPHGLLDSGGCFICFRRDYSGRGERGEPAWCAAVLPEPLRYARRLARLARAGTASS
jgi:hypothetical protein